MTRCATIAIIETTGDDGKSSARGRLQRAGVGASRRWAAREHGSGAVRANGERGTGRPVTGAGGFGRSEAWFSCEAGWYRAQAPLVGGALLFGSPAKNAGGIPHGEIPDVALMRILLVGRLQIHNRIPCSSGSRPGCASASSCRLRNLPPARPLVETAPPLSPSIFPRPTHIGSRFPRLRRSTGIRNRLVPGH